MAPLQRAIARTPSAEPALLSDLHASLRPPVQPLCRKPAYHRALLRLLASQPQKGRGHTWFFTVALHFRHYHTAVACERLLRACADTWERQVPDEEIRAAVRNAYCLTGLPGRPSGRPWPDVNHSAIERIVASTTPLFGRVVLPQTAAEVLNVLFRPDELVCAGASKSDVCVQPLRALLPNADRMEFVVPSPMLAASGTNQAGQPSRRCLSNTGARRFLVLEFDSTPVQHQALLHTHLNQILPLTLAVHSAGRSIHGWYHCSGQAEDVIRAFMAYAVSLGADPHTWPRCQLVRMPAGRRHRDDGSTALQPILYVDPHIERLIP